jgi:Xaa-Pro dipeptidase
MSFRRERARRIAAGVGADCVLAAERSTVTWLSGISAQVELGPSPFSLPAVVLLEAEGAPIAVLSEDHAAVARAKGCEVVTYPGYTTGPMVPLDNFTRALSELVDGRTVASEPGALPLALCDSITVMDVADALRRARAVKDPDEISAIRESIRIADAGQLAVRQLARPGLSEFEVWQGVQTAMETAAGARIPIAVDLLSGPRTSQVDGAPGHRIMSEGDLVITDLLCRADGYWSDSCSTIALGEPSAWSARAHERVAARLAHAIESVRPGVVAGDLDAVMRAGLEYPHHSGHGIGTSYHEEPRIVKGSPTVLEAGMVVALEPGLYGDEGGVRLERVVLVREDGAEVLSGHRIDL